MAYGEIGWDQEVTVTDTEYAVLEPGEYTYRVDRFERGRHEGGGKIGECSVAKLTLAVANAAGAEASVPVNLYLWGTQIWKLTQFFKSCLLIDPKLPEGASYRMPWDRVVGAMGRCRVKNREYNGKTYNEVESFIVPEGF